MAIIAYTTKNIDADTLASGMAVMDAYRATEHDFPKSMMSHASIANAAIHQGEAIKFTPDLSNLSVLEDIELHRGAALPYTIKLGNGDEVYETLHQSLQAQSHKTSKKGPSLDL